ncbi:MAG TPA: DHA2 family efflux MFS transporter permease subunit [Methanocorpusculum sp.]|nr:DHA2 family efflux MFS transporter permease subunit [Methanocorpusculum sp.]
MYRTVTDSSHLKKLLAVIALAIFIDSLDGSIVNIALPTIAEGFSVDMSTAAWVIMAYFLFLVGLIPLFGNVADHGRLQEVFCCGFVVFTVGSIASGLAPDLLMLVISRAVQGVGASMIAVVAPLLVVRLMPPHNWGMGMGMAAMAGAVALVFGPVLGGMLTECLSWHWCFFINVPVGIATVVLGLRIIPKAEYQPKVRLDLVGVVLIFTAMASLIYLLEQGIPLGWASPQVFFCGVVFAVSVVIFVLRELRVADPILRVRVFRSRPFTFVVSSYFLISVVYAGFLYIVPFYMSIVLKMSPAVSGMILLISSVITAVVGLPSGALSDRIGARWLVTAAGVGRVLFCCVMAVMLPEFGLFWILLLMVLSGLTFGISGGPSSARIIEHAPEWEGGTGSVVMMLSQYSGMVVGVALYALVFNLTVPGAAGVAVGLLQTEQFLLGFHMTGVFGAVCSVIAVVLSVVVKDKIAGKTDST